MAHFNRATTPAKLPIVLSRSEIAMLLNALNGTTHLVACLLYGSGLRRIEAVRMRVKDIDFDHHQLQVWNGKGNHHRLVTPAPELIPQLRRQLERVRLYLLENSQLSHYAGVRMPDALARKYRKAGRSLGW